MKAKFETRPYRPGSGMEGASFAARFCDRCIHDANFDPDTGVGGCQIIPATMGYEVSDPEYPKEWVTDEIAGPRCTKFERVKGDD